MANYIMVVTSGAQPGQEEEYNTWYDNQHIHDICAVPGIGKGQRWDGIQEVSPNPLPAPYLAIYEIEADDPAEVLAEMMRRSQAGEIPMTESIDLETAKIWIYKKHG